MKTKAAVLWELKGDWEVEEVELDPPSQGEVLVKLAASGLCHSDEHLRTGDLPIQLPVIGGHEGAGLVAGVGAGVTEVAEGDSVVLSFLPGCGRCSYCARGMANLCDLGLALLLGPQLDGTYRFHARGEDTAQMCLLGTFAEYTVVPVHSVVKIDPDIPAEKAALVGCGVTTGVGSVIRTAGTKAGDTVVVLGAGGVGINAIQGARIAGARHIVAVDPVRYKRQQSVEFGATHACASADEAWNIVSALTHGQLADACIIAIGIAEESDLQPALGLVGKRGRVIVTALGRPDDMHASMNLFELTLFEKQVLGSLYGSCNAQHDIPRMLELYTLGMLKLDELVTREYTLEQINKGYEDMRAGRNLRGLIRF